MTAPSDPTSNPKAGTSTDGPSPDGDGRGGTGFDAAEAAGFGGITWADEASDELKPPAATFEPEAGEDLSFGEGALEEEADGGADGGADGDGVAAGDGSSSPESSPEEVSDPTGAVDSPDDPDDPDGPDDPDEASSTSAPASASVEDLVGDLERVTAERDQYLEASRRLQAEFENYRKAVAKREADAKERANEHLVVEILPVLDACDGAMASGATDVEPVRSALVDALTKQGLERIDGQDTPFDPACHDAVMHEPDEEGEGPVVAEVMRAGYSWKGRVVRPAMVKVRG